MWLQYLLLPVPSSPVARATIVFATPLLLSWIAAAAAHRALASLRRSGAALRPS